MMNLLNMLMGTIFRIVQGAIIIALMVTAILVPTKIGCEIQILSIIISAVCGLSALVILFAAYGFAGVINALKAQVNLLASENKKYTELNLQYSQSLDKQEKIIEDQAKANLKMKLIQDKTQDLLSALMKEGDDFKNFNKILQSTTEKNLNLADKLEILTKDMINEKFMKLDENGDGFLTRNELLNN